MAILEQRTFPVLQPHVDKIIVRGRKHLFSKLHYTLDENNNLRFFFAFNVGKIKNFDSVISYEVIRHRRNFPNKKYLENKRIELNSVENLKVVNDNGIVYLSGIDPGFKRNGYYTYSATINVDLSGPESIERTGKAKLKTSAGRFKHGMYTYSHKFSTIRYEQNYRTNIVLSEGGSDFKQITVADARTLLNVKQILTIEENKKLLKRASFRKINDFLEQKETSKAATLAGLTVGTKPSRRESPERPKAQRTGDSSFVDLNFIRASEVLQIEYLANYNNMEYDYTNCVNAENWELLTSGFLDTVDQNEIVLARIKNPRSFLNKYFYIFGDTPATGIPLLGGELINALSLTPSINERGESRTAREVARPDAAPVEPQIVNIVRPPSNARTQRKEEEVVSAMVREPERNFSLSMTERMAITEEARRSDTARAAEERANLPARERLPEQERGTSREEALTLTRNPGEEARAYESSEEELESFLLELRGRKRSEREGG